MANPAVPEFVDLFRMASLQLLTTLQLADVEYGKVTSVNPLEITLDQKTKLTSKYLTLTNAVKDHSVDITVSWNTADNTHKHLNGNNGQPTADATHKHTISGRKRITIHNGLTLGERVLLLRKAGGQDYIVLDRIDVAKTTGESV